MDFRPPSSKKKIHEILHGRAIGNSFKATESGSLGVIGEKAGIEGMEGTEG